MLFIIMQPFFQIFIKDANNCGAHSIPNYTETGQDVSACTETGEAKEVIYSYWPNNSRHNDEKLPNTKMLRKRAVYILVCT